MVLNKHKCLISLTITFQLLFLAALSQDSSLLHQYNQVKDQYVAKINTKAASFNSDVDKYTIKALDRMVKQEKIMQKKMAKVDSSKAYGLFKYSIDSLEKFLLSSKSKTSLEGTIQVLGREIPIKIKMRKEITSRKM